MFKRPLAGFLLRLTRSLDRRLVGGQGLNLILMNWTGAEKEVEGKICRG